MSVRSRFNMTRLSSYLLVLFTLFAGKAVAQEKISFSGYLSDMQTVYHIPDHWLWENTLHNRLNLDLYPTNWLTGSIQLRNRA
ncbi:MAG: hypothetical protein KAS29_09820, partial [Bacteroidales bacterium]|nr:hypothetical protein [Bacteroidales bacterium]